ncbi:MAG TPA: SCO family protein [Saprospiraceae bacterium]|nr:SCO family protein [Saprospiraceae bacterium]
MNIFRYSFFLFSVSTFLFLVPGCRSDQNSLPYLGNLQIVNGDTIRHTVPDYLLTDQDSQQIRITGYGDKVFLADFFFVSCPSICPKVQKQMLRLYDRYKDDSRVMLFSHTIDQRHDSVTVLHRYAHNLGVDTGKWKFFTAEKDSIFALADDYFVSVVDDPSAPKGFDHSGKIILLDKNRHVRGFCEGTDPESVTAFFSTVDKLLATEYK